MGHALVITEKGQAPRAVPVDQLEVTIGRVHGNDVVLPRGNISKRHVRLVLRDGKWIIVDLKSVNGTFVNGKRISSPQVLKPSDKIYIGNFTLQLEEGAPRHPKWTLAPPGAEQEKTPPDGTPVRTQLGPMPTLPTAPPTSLPPASPGELADHTRRVVALLRDADVLELRIAGAELSVVRAARTTTERVPDPLGAALVVALGSKVGVPKFDPDHPVVDFALPRDLAGWRLSGRWFAGEKPHVVIARIQTVLDDADDVPPGLDGDVRFGGSRRS